METKMNFSLIPKLFLFSFALISLTNEAIGSSSNDVIKNKPDAKIDNFENINFLYKKQIKLWDENLFNELQVRLSRKYTDYLIINACHGKFNSVSRNGYNMTIVDPKGKLVAYIVAMPDKKGKTEIFELQKLNIDFSDRGYIRGRAGENICLSSKEIKKIRNDYTYKKNQSERFTNLTPRTNFDVVCVSPEGGDMEFICFEYDNTRNKFRDIGGWQNE